MQTGLLYGSTEQRILPTSTLQVGCNIADWWAFRGKKKAEASEVLMSEEMWNNQENLLKFDEEALQIKKKKKFSEDHK